MRHFNPLIWVRSDAISSLFFLAISRAVSGVFTSTIFSDDGRSSLDMFSERACNVLLSFSNCSITPSGIVGGGTSS